MRMLQDLADRFVCTRVLIGWLILGLWFIAPLHEAHGATSLEYSVAFEGIEDGQLQEELELVSDTVELRDRPPPTSRFLLRRAQGDVPEMLEILKAESYYRASIQVRLQKQGQDQYTVIFQARLGPSYRLARVDILPRGREFPQSLRLPSAKELGLELGEPARAELLRKARERLGRFVKAQGFALTELDQPEVFVDHQNASVRVAYPFAPGPLTLYGPVRIQGSQRVDQSFIRSRIPWQEAQVYSPEDIETLRERLRQTELFSLISIEHAGSLNDQGRLPFRLKLRERDFRRIRLGVNYYTDVGPGGVAGWEHRNLFGSGESLLLQGRGSAIYQGVEGVFKKPDFLDREQTLMLRSEFYREDTESYESRAFQNSVQLERPIWESVVGSLGLGYKVNRIDERGQVDTFQLLSIPLALKRDLRDDLLDPGSGTYLNLLLTLFEQFSPSQARFARTQLTANWYMELPLPGSPVVALRSSLGSIVGESTEDIPADERFYSGGGGSVRGFAFQDIGPREDGDPSGGSYLGEASLELRFKVTEKFGFALFSDAGSLSESGFFQDGLFVGAGAGLRYYTGVGPLRIDLAMPLNPDEDMDDDLQFYISLGQSF
jgi:translocation and assembly module TamA